jgi:chromosome partitioning protein
LFARFLARAGFSCFPSIVTITICNGKGGAGKTTLAVMLVLALRRCEHATGLIDRDPQGTASRWLATLEETAGPVASSATAVTVIDTPPQLDASALVESIRESDFVILVSSSSPADLWTSQATVETIRANLRPGASARLLFNQVQPNTLLGRDLADLASRIGLPQLKTHLRRRQVYQHAALLGWSALDKPARDEILSLAREVASLASPAPVSPAV